MNESENVASVERARIHEAEFPRRIVENEDGKLGLAIRQKLWYTFLRGSLFIGILAIAISFVYRSFRRVADFSSLNIDETDDILVPPDPEVPQPPSWNAVKSFKRAAVCADGAPCALIGKSMLDRNGSAVDAALAAMICNGLINMQSMGIGGGFLMTLYERSTGQGYFLDAREAAPIDSTSSMYEKQSATASRIGGLAIGVPGEIAGYWEAHRRFGKVPWSELFEPTIRLCREGYNLTKAQYDALYVHPPNIHEDPTLREMFVTNDNSGKKQFAKPGTLIRPRKLCDTLQLIAHQGASILYNGTLGERLIEDLKKRSSILTMKDLNDYRARWSSPIRTSLSGGSQLYTSGLPSSGPLLALVLNILENYRFHSRSMGNFGDTIITHHRIIEAWKYAFAEKTRLADGNFVNLSELIDKLTSKAYARAIRDKIRDDLTWNDTEHYGATNAIQEDHGTAHISVLGTNGDAVSVTSSINLYFGSGVVSESTGILMNSGMDDFGTTSGVNYFGLPAGKNNAIEPGKRSHSSMVPSIIVRENGDARMIIGGAGGTRILTAVSYVCIEKLLCEKLATSGFAVVARHLWMNNTIKEAIDAPRIHHQLFPMILSYEYGVTRPVLEGLARLGHRTFRYRDRGSVISAIACINGTLYACPDYRKNGDVSGID